LCSNVGEGGEIKGPVAASSHRDIHRQVDEISTIADVVPFKIPVVAPALKNLGILCYY